MEGAEAFALPAPQPPKRAMPPLARWVSTGLSGALVVLALAHLAVELSTL
jgi:hypothetical protein